MSTMKPHPLSKAKEADLFAVRFDVNRWGFIRIFRGSALGIWDRWAQTPDKPAVSSDKQPEKWFYHFLSPKQDVTEMVALGSVPFCSDDQAWPPPCYYAPDVFQDRHRIYFHGMFRDATAGDVVGLRLCERVNPSQLVAKLQTLFADGLLVQE